jgi:hypothetical protein
MGKEIKPGRSSNHCSGWAPEDKPIARTYDLPGRYLERQSFDRHHGAVSLSRSLQSDHGAPDSIQQHIAGTTRTVNPAGSGAFHIPPTASGRARIH